MDEMREAYGVESQGGMEDVVVGWVEPFVEASLFRVELDLITAFINIIIVHFLSVTVGSS
jgi:hypothetical protein